MKYDYCSQQCLLYILIYTYTYILRGYVMTPADRSVNHECLTMHVDRVYTVQLRNLTNI